MLQYEAFIHGHTQISLASGPKELFLVYVSAHFSDLKLLKKNAWNYHNSLKRS